MWDYKDLLYGPIADFPRGLLVVFIIWSTFWKGVTLWRSAKNSQKYWFITLLVLSTGGILEIIYLAFFQKRKK